MAVQLKCPFSLLVHYAFYIYWSETDAVLSSPNKPVDFIKERVITENIKF